MACGVHVGDIGTDFRITIQDCDGDIIDISSATSKTIIFKKPNGSLLTKDADFVTDGTDGLINYIVSSGDIDAAGSWKIQSQIIMPSGTWSSDFQTFKVHRNL
jgi:hypothetical protein